MLNQIVLSGHIVKGATLKDSATVQFCIDTEPSYFIEAPVREIEQLYAGREVIVVGRLLPGCVIAADVIRPDESLQEGRRFQIVTKGAPHA